MPLPDVETLCVHLAVTGQAMTVTFPGGAELSPQLASLGVADPAEVAKQLLGQANAALAPLVPIFDLIDVVMALVNAVKAIPDAISHLNPGKVTQALPDVGRTASKLLRLVPQVSVPVMVAGLVDVVLALLEGLAGQLRAMMEQEGRTARAAARAAELGNAQLATVVACSTTQLRVQMENLGESLRPVSRLLALVGLFSEIVGLPAPPQIDQLGTEPGAAMSRLEDITHALTAARRAVPV